MFMIQSRPRPPEKGSHLREEKKKKNPGDTYDLTFMSLFLSALYFPLFRSNANILLLVKSISSAGTTFSLQSKATSKKY